MYEPYIFFSRNLQKLTEGKTLGFAPNVFIELREEITTGFIRKIFVGLGAIIGFVRYVLI